MSGENGTLKGKDGAGHVAVVEQIIDENTILTSESFYGGKAFVNVIRKNTNKNWGQNSKYIYRGNIINPAIRCKQYTRSRRKWR